MKLRDVLGAVLWSALLAGQSFDVVSVKHSGNTHIVMTGPGRVTIHNAPVRRTGTKLTGNTTLESIIKYAYSLKNDWEIAGPDWVRSEMYDVAAVLPAETSDADARRMLANMLADRFGLGFHREERELSVRALVVAKGGLKLEEIPKPEHYSYGFKGGSTAGTTKFEANPGMSMSALAVTLKGAIGEPVLDQTGLTGTYRIEAEWTVQPGEQTNEGLVAALSRFGLRLEKQKATFEVLVIDKVSKEPTAN